ncbi:MAG: ATP-binding protein [Magnetococcus sp. MYC-9]
MQPDSTFVARHPLAGLTGGMVQPHDPVHGLIQRLLPALLAGDPSILLVTGPGGSGKTQLVSGLAQATVRQGWIPVALAATPFQPLSSGRILAAFSTFLMAQGRAVEAGRLRDPRLSVEERLRETLAAMRHSVACLLVLDGLESCLDVATGRFLEPAMETFWSDLLSRPLAFSRLLVGSRLRPAGENAPCPAFLRQEPLQPWQGAVAGALRESQSAALAAMDEEVLLAMAIFHYPVPVAGFCAVTGYTETRQEKLLRLLQRQGLAEPYVLPDGEHPLWSLHPLVRVLLAGKKAASPGSKVHPLAGEYLSAKAEQRQQASLGLGWLDLAQEAVGHFLHCSASRRSKSFARLLRCATPIMEFYALHGLLWEQERLNRALLAMREHPRPLYMTAMVLLRRHQSEEARPLLERVLAFGDERFPRENALALFELANLIMEEQAEEGREKLQRALAINQRVGDRSGEAVCHAHLGLWGLQQMDMGMAQHHLESALTLCRQLNDRIGISNLLSWTGELFWRVGNTAAARRHFQEALQLLDGHNDREIEAQLLHRLAVMDLGEEAFDQALRGFLRSLEIKRAQENRKGEAATFFQLGRLAKAKGLELASLRLLGLCQRIGQDLGDPEAKQTLILFYELAATALGLRRLTAQALLEEVWSAYCRDRGRSLITQIFANG